MRNILLYIFTLTLFLFFSSSLLAQIHLGGGLTFANGDNLSKLGLNLRGTYEAANEKLVIAPGVSFFFKDKSLRDATVSYFSVDLDARYRLINIGEDIEVYPVGGLNFFNVKIDGDSSLPVLEKGVNVGLNLGLGTQIASSTSDLNYFGEFKFRVGGEVNSTITAGVLYGF